LNGGSAPPNQSFGLNFDVPKSGLYPRRSTTVPIAFIAARDIERDSRPLMKLGAHGVIAKPFDPMALAAQVRNYLPDD
jgi:DNA-binding response OmpR family regulator